MATPDGPRCLTPNPTNGEPCMHATREFGHPRIAYHVDRFGIRWSDSDTITDGTGRRWVWSDMWNGYRSEGMLTHGYETIKSQWGISD